MTGILVMDEGDRRRLANLRSYAESRPYTLEQALAGPPFGDNPMHAVNIPLHYRIVYSIHELTRKGDPEARRFLCRHASISSGRPGLVPRPDVFDMVLPELGFTRPFARCIAYEETFGLGEIAINAVEPIDPELRDDVDPAHGGEPAP